MTYPWTPANRLLNNLAHMGAMNKAIINLLFTCNTTAIRS